MYLEDYTLKAKTIFKLINDYRRNPKLLAKHLEKLLTYLDRTTNVLSEPEKIQIQMVEGEDVFKEAIAFLSKLPSLQPLEWDENLAQSALEHVNDIGPKGLLLYQSSDGTEPEDRIAKYGTFVDSLGENIDFGPNDAMGVIVSLTLDDGEQQRPHRENIFKQEYRKVGIACGPHKTEFQMCVMDFAYDFIPLNNNKKQSVIQQPKQVAPQKKNNKVNNSMYNEPLLNLDIDNNDEVNRTDIGYYGDNNRMNKMNNYHPPQTTTNNQSPFVKLSLDNDDFRQFTQQQQPQKKQNEIKPMSNYSNQMIQKEQPVIERQPVIESSPVMGQPVNNGTRNENGFLNEIDGMTNEVKMINNNKKIVKKTIDIVTTVTYIYEDDSFKELVDRQSHTFNC